ncbi:MAG: hypothetical protein BWY67_01875 [Bacteroidetes bacterium ADurb.Bin397]|nr:MAG: hypothetical protein BWY67_01875 [Bacteroidetes bacterium ADurb.Bin397]
MRGNQAIFTQSVAIGTGWFIQFSGNLTIKLSGVRRMNGSSKLGSSKFSKASLLFSTI